MGGLGIKDLDKFGRSLHLRWLWNNWDPQKPWRKLKIIEDAIDRDFFFASTEVDVGNGVDTPFWEAQWCFGKAPRNTAPNLFGLAKQKKRTVAQELRNHNWIRNIQALNSDILISEFLVLQELIQQVQLTDQEDRISWKWGASGSYSAKSAYNAQFLPGSNQSWASKIWSAQTLHKCKFFAWTAIQHKINTDDVMQIKNWQHNSHCSLCAVEPETAHHLLKGCTFTHQVWNQLVLQLQLQGLANTINVADLKHWLCKVASSQAARHESRRLRGILLFFWWEIWKERNRRIFQHSSLQLNEVVNSIKDDLLLFDAAESVCN